MNRLIASLFVLVPVCSSFAGVGHAQPAKALYEDNDPGSAGPMQDAHDGEIVFANTAIAKNDGNPSKLVIETSLLKPLYVRMFSAKTPARVLNENAQACPATQVRVRWSATLEGAPAKTRTVQLREARPSATALSSARTATVQDLAGKGALSIVPRDRVVLPDENDTLYPRFLSLAAQMKPGKNVVTLTYEVGCEGHPGKNDRQFTAVSRGQIAFDVKPGDVAAFTKRVGPDMTKGMDPAAEARLRPDFERALPKGAKILSFAGFATATEPAKKDTVLRAIVKSAEGACTYRSGHWIEPYAGGTYGPGRFEVSAEPSLIPCP